MKAGTSQNRTVARRVLLALGAGAAIVACRDELTAPVDCPALCPGGQPAVQEVVVPALPGQDSSFIGYVTPGLGISLRVSNGLAASEDRAIIRFLPRPDTLLVAGSFVTYTVDSVAFSLTLQARDTTVDGLRLLLYRLPPTIDTLTTFADVIPELVPANIIDTIPVPDSLASGQLRVVLEGAELSRVAIPAADSGKLAIGVALEANTATGVRIASIAANGSPSFVSYLHANVADTALQKQVLSRFPAFTSFVTQNPPSVPPDLLLVGGAPSARSLLRFDLPALLEDSVTILRATLELTLDQAVQGLPLDTALLQAVGVVGDLGAKSPLITGSAGIGTTPIPDGASGTISIEVTRLIRFWQGEGGLPQLIFLVLAPEASSFTVPAFRSSGSPSGQPQLRITYYDRFPFQRP